MKDWYKSKTMWLGISVGLLGTIQTALATSPLPAEWIGPIGMGLGALIAFLRKLTAEPIA